MAVVKQHGPIEVVNSNYNNIYQRILLTKVIFYIKLFTRDTGQTSACSQVLNSEKFHLFLTECEESVSKLMAEVATKFYNLGFQEGRQIAVQTTTRSARIVSLFSGGVVLYMHAYNHK